MPLAAAEIAGVLNLRGRIVTLIDLRRRLGLGARTTTTARPWRSASNCSGESYGLLIDSVGEVLKLDEAGREPNPINLDPRLARVSAGIYRLDAQLLVVVDVDRVLDIGIDRGRGMNEAVKTHRAQAHQAAAECLRQHERGLSDENLFGR